MKRLLLLFCMIGCGFAADSQVFSVNANSYSANTQLNNIGLWASAPFGGYNNNYVYDPGNSVYRFAGAGAFALSRYSQALNDDQYTEGVLVNDKPDGSPGVMTRLSASGGYACEVLANGALLLKKVWDWNNANLATGSMTFVTGDVLRIEAAGNSVKCMKNGATVLSVTDASYTSGTSGIYFQEDSWMRNGFTQLRGGNIITGSGGGDGGASSPVKRRVIR